MAKTPKLEKNAQSTSLRSRAAKRASSPSINLDKSLTSLKPPVDNSSRHKSVLSAQHAAGITKKKVRGKKLSRQQRLRQEKGLERAEAVIDKKEKKVERSLDKGKKVKERNAAWDDLNSKIQNKPSRPEREIAKKDDWEEDEMEVEVDISMPQGRSNNTSELETSTTGVRDDTKPLDEEDEIL